MLDWLQMDGMGPAAARGLIGFVIAWALLKTGKKRFLKRGSAFDALCAIMIGAVLGRGISEGGAFFDTIAAAAVIIAAHWAFSWLSYHVPGLSPVLEGHPRVLISNGVMDRRQMAKALVSEADLEEALRLRTGLTDLTRVETARQERSGKISLKLSDRDAR
jgi:uncharacterized membrane protein YcaP (DUF421 family)